MENEELQEVPPEEVAPDDVPAEELPPVEELDTYIDYAEMYGGMYSIDFIKTEICVPEMDYSTIFEFEACQSWYQTEAQIAFGNLFIGIVLGLIVVKGLFDSWR